MDLMFIVMRVCLMVCFEFKIELPGGCVVTCEYCQRFNG